MVSRRDSPIAFPARLPERLLFVRHAESVWNAEGRWQGQADPVLSEAGCAQLSPLWEAVASQFSSLAGIASSDLSRARSTAAFLAERSRRSLWVTRRLRERDAGRWTGISRSRAESHGSELLVRIRGGDLDAAPPEGESRREVLARVNRGVAESLHRTGGRAFAVVSHLGVLRALVPGAEAENATAGWLKLSRDEGSCVVVSAWEPLF